MEKQNKPIAKCHQCGEVLSDGDTAYLLDDSYYCPGCVEEALVVCRPHNYYDYETIENRIFRKDD